MVDHTPVFWRKFYGLPIGSLRKECYKSSQKQQEVRKVAPRYDATKKERERKKSLLSQ